MRTHHRPFVIAAFTLTVACEGDPTEAPFDGDDTGGETDGSATDGDPTNGSNGSASATGPMTDPTAADADTSASSADDDTSDTQDDAGTTGSPEGVAQIRFVHASASATRLDVYLAGTTEPLVMDLAYGAASDYLEVPLADLALELRVAGASADEPPAFTTGALDIAENARVTAVAAGIVDAADADTSLRLLPLVEAFEDPGADRAAVRIVNAGTDAAALDFDIGQGPEPVDRFADSGAAGVVMPAAAALQLAITGDVLDTAFTTPPFAAGGDVFVIAAGELDAVPREISGLGLIVLGPQGVVAQIQQNPTLYALQAAIDSGAMNVCVDTQVRVVDATFGNLTRIQLPPGEHELRYYFGATDCTETPVLAQSTGELVAGQQYLMVVSGELVPETDNPPLGVTRLVEAFPLDAEPSAVVALLHAASAPELDLGVLEGGLITQENVLASDVAYGEVSDFIVLAAGDYQLGIVPAATPLPAPPYGPIPTSVAEGMRTWTIAVGDVAPSGGDVLATIITVVTSENPWVAVPM